MSNPDPPVTRQRSRVRHDIQALRAIAVLLVVINHLWPERLPGGYVGVDVFFVISGFLITAHLLGEIRRSDRISLSQFYARRARRLLPAALLVGVVTLAATVIWLPAERWARIAREIFASAAYVENWILTASSVNYSDRGQAATPAQHYWSLSVEEQFYLLWPLTLLVLGWLLARGVSGRIASRNGALLGSIAVLAAASLLFSIWQTGANPAAAYFNTFGRVWEFMVGALLAVCAPAVAAWCARRPALALRGVAQLVGYGAILGAALWFTEATPFPGWWALLPTLGTALVIVAGPELPRWSPARLGSWLPVQYLGGISYSLYLWHWPLIVIAPFVLARDLGTADRVALLAISILLAALTKRFIEDPGRTKLFAGARPRRTLLATLASVAVVGLLAGGTVWAAGAAEARDQARLDAAQGSGCFGAEALDPERDCADPFGPAMFPAGGESEAPWSAVAPECALQPDERQIFAEGKPSYVECDFGAGAGGVGGAGGDASVPATSDPYRVWLVGDSHAEHWKAAVNEIGRANEWRVAYTMQGGCPSVATPLVRAFGGETDQAKRDSCASWITEVSERIVADAPDLVLVSNFASAEEIDDGSGRPQPEQLAAAMGETLVAWADAGAQVVVIRDVPTAGTALGPDCVSQRGTQQGVQRGAASGACVAPEAEVLPPDPQIAAIELLGDPRITSVDLSERFCRDGLCSGVIGTLPVFYDTDHVSASYARSLAPALSRELGAALDRELHAPAAR
ncbi:peptidoglycan/LPS O-acetylase OafA/YrhL [Leucobacter luti]|uniref:Peptidoglycan/LPS O-acetylase OafA/YrhL n=1 Tax=Leucobacter luti TaxID=340320 RepID=A0A4R6RZF5_9MICO|nr:acyltransferase family protein [Leucobacter luti]TDP91686.1 peptidoglycan/LPS O-acetylase OafA/YrhL [Leucobacter luti]